MEKESNNIITFGFGSVCEILAIVFTILKLTHVIDWSWWWVLSPLWIGLILGIIIFAVCFMVLLHGSNHNER